MSKKPSTTPDSVEELAMPTPAEPEAVDPVISADYVSELTTQISELTSDLQRTRADFENYRKQVDAQRLQAMSSARFATVEKFLPVIDDFSRAITVYPDVLQPVAKNLQKMLDNLGLAVIDSMPGTEFNPDFHEAAMFDDGDGDTEVIVETLRPGYLYEGSVLRPAMVKVGRA